MRNGKKTSQDKSDAVTLELRRLGVKIEHVDDKISLAAEMIGNLAVNIEIVKEDIEFIKSGFKKKVDIEEFAALTRRVSLLEKRR